MSVRAGVLVISDRSWKNERVDTSGPTVINRITELGWEFTATRLVPDDREMISAVLIEWCDSNNIDIILTTGGTGFSTRDVTPEATSAVIERLAPGLSEAMHYFSFQLTPHAMLSRSIAGIRGNTLIVNLPGSPKAALENLNIIVPVIPHAVELLRGNPGSEAGHIFQNRT